MKFESAALALALALSGEAFLVVPSNRRTSSHIAFRSQRVDTTASRQSDTSPLPPSHRSKSQARPPESRRRTANIQRRKTKKNRKKSYNDEEATPKNFMPDEVRKLSDVLKAATPEDFSGKVCENNWGVSEEGASDVESETERPRAATRKQQTARHRNGVHNDSNRRLLQVRKSSTRNKKLAEEDSAEPWKANFRVSKQTQARIQAAGNPRNYRKASPTSRAIHVLETLLNEDPTRCNEANVVCALTVSAKILGASPLDSYRHAELLELQLKTLDVLHTLVGNEQLNARQLCNAVWAIAKFYNRDVALLPPPPEVAAMSTESVLGTAETWVLQNEPIRSAEKRVCETIDEIAAQLKRRLLQVTDVKQQQPRLPKVGEMSMACWAYGVLRPRRLPPGWSAPPQMGLLPKEQQQQQNGGVEYITFEQWSKDHEDDDAMDEQTFSCSNDVTDELLDAIGETLVTDQMAIQHDGETRNEDGTRSKSVSLYNDNSLIQTLTWNELANVAWAYATHGHCRTLWSEQVMLALAKDASRRLHEGDTERMLSRDIAQLVWALGTLQSDNFRLGDDLVELIDSIAGHYLNRWKEDKVNNNDSDDLIHRPLEDWSCADLVQVAISMAHGRIDHLPLLKAIYEESNARIYDTPERGRDGNRRSFRIWELSVLLWAQARLYLRFPSHGDAFDDFCHSATKNIVSSLERANMSLYKVGIGPQEQANIAWSLTVLEQVTESHLAAKLVSTIFQEAASTSDASRIIQLEHAHQLWQSLFLLEETAPEVVQNVPRWFRDFLKEKWSVEKARRKQSSARHRSLSQTLKLMGVAHYNEHDEDIDVAIVLKDDSSWTSAARFSDHADARFKVAVEFDGPNHFTREIKSDGGRKNSPPRALGHTVLKYRLLKRQGWTVVRVPYFEFDKIPFWASMERQRYLQRLLKTHANISFSSVDVSEYKPIVANRATRFD